MGHITKETNYQTANGRYISTIEAVNKFLPDFIKRFNQRFAFVPDNPNLSYGPCPSLEKLDEILSWHQERKASKSTSTKKPYRPAADHPYHDMAINKFKSSNSSSSSNNNDNSILVDERGVTKSVSLDISLLSLLFYDSLIRCKIFLKNHQNGFISYLN